MYLFSCLHIPIHFPLVFFVCYAYGTAFTHSLVFSFAASFVFFVGWCLFVHSLCFHLFISFQ